MFVFKIIILGDQGNGKTSLMNKYVENKFVEHEAPTIGIEFASKTKDMCQIFDEQLLKDYREQYGNKYYQLERTVKLQIWNSSGQERFHSIVSTYYRNTHGVIFVCDLTRRPTMEHLRKWIDDYNKYATNPLDKVSGIVVGMKSDLRSQHQITEEELQQFANEYGLKSFTVSAKYDTTKIENVFNEILSQMFRRYINDDQLQNTIKYTKETDHDYLLQVDNNKSKKRCCNIL
jgi:small GTP-binding protein